LVSSPAGSGSDKSAGSGRMESTGANQALFWTAAMFPRVMNSAVALPRPDEASSAPAC
jgi:hypothetical protein